MADIKLGIATAPVLFAQKEFPQLDKLVKRKFEAPGDVEEAHACIKKSDGLAQTRKMAFAHVGIAMDLIDRLTPSPERDALFKLCDLVCTRTT